MTTGERLAAFLAGELGADEHAALQAELARDPALRARLAQIRATDTLLGELPEITPDADFSSRLRDAVRAEVATVPDDGVVVPASELADRRARRRSRFQRAAAGVAAAAAVAAGVVVLGTVGGNDDEGLTAADSARELDQEAGTTAESAAGAAALAPVGPEPVLADGGRYDETSLASLAQDPRLRDTLNAAAADPLALALRARELGLTLDATSRSMAVGEAAGGSDTATQDGDGSTDDAAEESIPQPPVAAVDPAVLDPVLLANRCLPAIYAEGRELVPLWLETATFDGEPALVAVLASRGTDGRLSRLETYAIAAADCHVLYFTQAEA